MNRADTNMKFKNIYSASIKNNKLNIDNKMQILSSYKKVNEEQLALISGNLAQLYKDGISINTALELIEEVISNKSYKNSLSKVLSSIKEGKTLSEGFKEFEYLYPSFFTGILSIGENSGKLYEVLKGLNMYYEKVIFIKREFINASIYPIFIFISLIVFGGILLNTVIPSFYDIYDSMDIMPPAICKYLYEINLNLKTNTLIMICFMVSWGLLLPAISLRHILNNIKTHRFTKINIVKCYYEYMMVLLFSIITSSGVNISYALEYCELGINSDYLKEKINEINKNILKGNTLNESLQRTGMFSKYVLAIIKIREESGSIEEGFKELNSNLESKLIKKIQRYLSFIQPLLVVFMGILILAFLIIFILPLFNNLRSGIR